MGKIHLGVALAMLMALAACTENKAPQPAGEAPSVREKAETVGKFGDRTVTSGLEQGLTGAVDASEKHSQELDEAAQE